MDAPAGAARRDQAEQAPGLGLPLKRGILNERWWFLVCTPQQRLGRWAEQRALRLLSSRGWRLLSRNWSCRWGELDLVVAKDGRLLIVEVKGRRRGRGWDGVAALGAAKRRRLGDAMACWLAAHPAWAGAGWELVAALVPLPPARGPVRWIRWAGR